VIAGRRISARIQEPAVRIMPDVPSGFTHVPTIMIAERLSEELVPLL
jgi:hypothetical protein